MLSSRAFALSLLLLAIPAALCSCAILFRQDKLIYRPRIYNAEMLGKFSTATRSIVSVTSQGEMSSWYVPPRSGEPQVLPARLWIIFGGNSGVATDWAGFARDYSDDRCGWLLIEYPGYGKNGGRPSPKAILEASEAAVDGLAREFGTDRAALLSRATLMGHSLGSATCLQFAANNPTSRVVLLAPFTSLRKMARRLLGTSGGWVLSSNQNYNNTDRMRELSAREIPPRVLIIHGAKDNVVPSKMGEELAAEFPEFSMLLILPEADHISIFYAYRPDVFAALAGFVERSDNAPSTSAK